MERDIRSTPLFAEVEQFYRNLHAPGSGRITDTTDLCVSADGRRVSFTGLRFDSLAAAPTSCIATVDPANGAVALEPNCPAGSRLPRWSPDGSTLAFLSDAQSPGDHRLQISRAGRVASAPPVEGVIESMAWSPDGRRLLIGVAGYGADLAGCQGGVTTHARADSGPAWLPTLDSGDAENLWRHVWVLDVEASTLRRVSPARLNVWESCWLGNGQIAAVASDAHDEGAWYTARMVAIDVIEGQVRDLVRVTDQLGVPAANPQGSRLAYIDAVCSDRMIVCGELQLVETGANSVSAPRRLDTRGVEVTHVAWRNVDELIYVGMRGLETVIGEVHVSANRTVELWANSERTGQGFYPSIAPLPDGGVLMWAEGWAVAPELVRIDAAGQRVLCSLASEAASVPGACTSRAQTSVWAGRDGLEIQGVLITPAGEGPWPLVVDVHGGPIWGCRDRWQGRLRGARVLADHGVASLYPNPRGSGGRCRDFADRVRGDMGGEDTHDILCGVDALIERGIADPKRLGVTGISYGGYMSSWLVTQDTRFAAAVPISPVTNWYSQHRTSHIPYFDALFLDGQPSAPNGLFHARSPVMFADRVRTPVLQLTGALDRNTPPTQAIEFHRSLLEHGVTSKLAIYPTAGHGIRSFPEVLDATTRYVGWMLRHFDMV